MADCEADAAADRLEAALERIAAAAARSAAAPADAGAPSSMPEMAERLDALIAQLRAALDGPPA